MDLSKLSQSERTAVIAGAVVVILGVVSIINDWGTLMIVPILAGLAVVAAILMPQLSPSTTLPAPTSTILLVGGGLAALVWVIVAISWLDWIFGHLASFDTLQFLVGLVAALVLAWAAWQGRTAMSEAHGEAAAGGGDTAAGGDAAAGGGAERDGPA